MLSQDLHGAYERVRTIGLVAAGVRMWLPAACHAGLTLFPVSPGPARSRGLFVCGQLALPARAKARPPRALFRMNERSYVRKLLRTAEAHSDPRLSVRLQLGFNRRLNRAENPCHFGRRALPPLWPREQHTLM